MDFLGSLNPTLEGAVVRVHTAPWKTNPGSVARETFALWSVSFSEEKKLQM